MFSSAPANAVRAQARYLFAQCIPVLNTYPASIPVSPLGSNFSLFSPRASLGLKSTSAPKSIFSPLNSSPRSLNQALCKGIVLRSSGQGQVVVQFQFHACVDQFWTIVRVHLLDLPPPAEVLDSSDNRVSIPSRSWISHDKPGIYVSNDERIPGSSWSPGPRTSLPPLKAPVRDLKCLIFALTHDSQKGFRYLWVSK